MSKTTLTTLATLAIALAGAATLATSAYAQDSEQPKTREQVLAELAQAKREGTIPSGVLWLTGRERFPEKYHVAASTKTRDEVVAELAQARREGTIPSGVLWLTGRERFPEKYHVAASTKTRAEVKAEYAEAVRTGDLIDDGEVGQKLSEEFPLRYATAKKARASGRLISQR
jgi:ribosomal protein L31E